MYNKYGRKSKNYRRKSSYNYRNTNYKTRNRKPVKKDRFLNVMIFVVLIALSYVTMDMLNVSLPSSVTSKISDVFNSDLFSFSKAKDKVVSFVNNTASVFNGGKTNVADSSSSLKLEMPVNGEVITTFEDTSHPVFNTTVKPRGIEIQTQKSEEVFASASGVVTNIVSSSYGGSRVVFDVGNNTTVVYDGIKSAFVKVGDNVTAGNIIGSMDNNESGNVLGFEVWVDNTAVDPMTYMELDVEGNTDNKSESK
ncbi:M23 family metallopeptidase [Anaerofustis sp.]|uniref:M23 family metallopeptidase n=1 Tax=Anaerofustis sp. TaxID=1872517 RepID=UPI0025BF25CE|nr:M23 family metallopeptidase [Anaerofustis sp.]